MKKRVNKLDEMQEQKLLHIEKKGCWFAFWGLLASMFIQLAIYGPGEFRYVAGEWIVFMCLALYMTIVTIKNGIWDRKLDPNPKTNLIVSLIASVLSGLVFTLISYINYRAIEAAIATFVVVLIMIFAMTMIGLSISTSIYKKRLDKMEKEEE